jgi:hypothetical protein
MSFKSKIAIDAHGIIFLKHSDRGPITIESPWSNETIPLRIDRIMPGQFIYFGTTYLPENGSIALHFLNLEQSLSTYHVWVVCAETGSYLNQSKHKFNLGRRGFMEFTLHEVTDISCFAEAIMPFANDLTIYQFIKYVLNSERAARAYIQGWKPNDSPEKTDEVSETPIRNGLSCGVMLLYNHNYARNIQVLDEIYMPRYSDVLHVLPNISPIHSRCLDAPAGSYQYHLLICHGLKHLMKQNQLCKGSDWLLIVQDDVLVHSSIDQSFWTANLDSTLHIGAFPRNNFANHSTNDGWYWNERIEIASLQPKNRIGGSGFEGFESFFQSSEYSRGVSDIFVIHRNHIEEFCELLSFYVSQNVFPEVAIPTALNIICNNNNKSLADIDGIYLWLNDRTLIESKEWMKQNFYSTKKIFIHPVKTALQSR